MNTSLSPFAPENLVSRDGFSLPAPSRVSLLYSILRLYLVVMFDTRSIGRESDEQG